MAYAASSGQVLSANLESAERALVLDSQFGDSGAILSRAAERYLFALEIFSHYLPVIAALLPEIRARGDQMFRDPLVKLELESAIRRLEAAPLTPPDRLEQALRAALRSVDPVPGARGAPSTAPWPLLLSPDARADTRQATIGQTFRAQFVDGHGESAQWHPAHAEAASRIDRATSLLRELLPAIGRSVPQHLSAIGIVEISSSRGSLLSASGGDEMPATIALASTQLADPWAAASRLLHESLHLKYFDISRCQAIVAAPWSRVAVPWRAEPWTAVRAMVSFHVYAHLLVFLAAARQADDTMVARYGAPDRGPMVSRGSHEAPSEIDAYRRAAERAQFLYAHLNGPWSQYLTPAGRRMVQWLQDSIAPLSAWECGPGHAATSVSARRPEVAGPGRLYAASPGLRLQENPALQLFMAFNPATRRLHCLNQTSWSLLTRCDHRSLDSVEREYAELVRQAAPRQAASPRDIRSLVAGGLLVLESAGLVTSRTLGTEGGE